MQALEIQIPSNPMLETKSHSIADRAFRPIGKMLKEDLKANVFFNALQPEKWEVRYFGTLPDADLDKGQRDIRSMIEGLPLNVPTLTWTPAELHQSIKNLLNHSRRLCKNSGDYLAAAQSILSSQSVALGNTRLQEGDCRTPWSLEADPRPLKLFQTALEMAVNPAPIFHDCHHPDEDGIFFRRLGLHNNVLEVDGYLKRKNLIDRRTVPAFIAEYLTALDGDIGLVHCIDPALVKHLFLPISGLGQWRATVSWFQTEANGNFLGHFHRSEVAAMSELYTYAIIDSFIGNMSSQIMLAGNFKRGAFIRAFAELFWALEIAAYNRDDMCELLLRDGSGELQMCVPNNNPASLATCNKRQSIRSEFLEIYPIDGSPFKNVQINLLALLRHGESDILNEHVVRKFMGFDTVVMRAPFIDVKEPDIRRYSEYLCERLRALLELQTARAGALEREGMSAMTHFSKGWINATDHAAAADGLRASGLTHEPAVAKAIVSLEMFQNVIAINELIRLWTIDSDKDRSKIMNWVSEDLIMEFRDKPDATYKRYFQFIKDAVMTIAYGLGYHHEIRYEIVDECRQVSESIEVARHGPMSNMDRWIRDEGAVAPFSACDGPTSHIVLLALLAEPIFNAVRVLRKCKPVCDLPHISVRFSRQNKEDFLIEVTNAVCNRPARSIPSLERIAAIYRQVGLAEVSYASSESPDGQLTFTVKIELMPISFAEHILHA